jgi:ribosomal protein L17
MLTRAALILLELDLARLKYTNDAAPKSRRCALRSMARALIEHERLQARTVRARVRG